MDLTEIREQLSQILSSDKIPHALLFSGPKGLGKTSAARIVAKAINCERKKKTKEFEPCNACVICESINKGNCLDLIEIDAASNRGIDDIRELRERIKLSPSRAKKKVYVIDEVHMLTTEAFNALLKTLEEPPEHAFFILCTTEPHKLPETIISRCLRLNFRKATPEELLLPLRRIERAEKLKLGVGVLPEIVKHADGCFRDAVKILEQMTFKDTEITLKQVVSFFGKDSFSVSELFKFLFDKNAINALKWLQQAVKNGVDLKVLTINILEDLRKILLSFYDLTEGNVENYHFSKSEILRLISLFDQAGRQLKGAVIPSLPLETVIVEWCDNSLQSPASSNQKQASSLQPPESSKLTTGTQKLETGNWKLVAAKWPDFLRAVKSHNHSTEALLKAAKPIELTNDRLVIEVRYPFHKNKLESNVCLSIAEKAAPVVFGKKLKIKYILKK